MMGTAKNNLIKPEILAPAGSMEALRAAAYCGADAVYLGAGRFSARAYAQNFSKDELTEAVTFCHQRGMAVHMALNTLLLNQRELSDAVATAHYAAAAGVDALIVQDLSLAAALRKTLPNMPLHASTQLSVTDAAGAALMKELGFSRVVVGREVSAEELKAIIATGIDVEVFIHGALCMSVSGQCYISAALGGRSGNRGRCAGACRLPFENYCLSLKDLSHIRHAKELAEMGVVSFKIEGRMRRPEYVAAAVTAVRKALNNEEFDEELLAGAFSRSGLTDGYFTGRRGSDMFGFRSKDDVDSMAKALPLLKPLCDKPSVFVPITMEATVVADTPMTLTVSDGVHTVSAEGDLPQAAQKNPLTAESLGESLQKTGDTPYEVTSFAAQVGDGLFAAKSALNKLRREALDKLTRLRLRRPMQQVLEYKAESYEIRTPRKAVQCAVVTTAEQLQALDRSSFDRISVPLSMWREAPVDERSSVTLPRALFGGEEKLRRQLQEAYDGGVTTALCSTLGAAALAAETGFAVWGDFSLCCTNSQTAKELYGLGVDYITLSPESDYTNFADKIPGHIQVGTVAYGKLPLMVTRNCPVKQTDHYKGCTHKGCYITDRMGVQMPVVCDQNCSHVLNARPIWAADRLHQITQLDFITLLFTDESGEETARIAKLYKTGGSAPFPFTRGLAAAIASYEKDEGRKK